MLNQWHPEIYFPHPLTAAAFATGLDNLMDSMNLKVASNENESMNI